MAKIILIIIGILAFLCIIGHLDIEREIDPIMLNTPWVIMVLCAGFYGIIEVIEKGGKNK